MKHLLTAPEYRHWGIASIWGYAIKNKLVNLSLSSWYHYNTLFSFRKHATKGRKPKYLPLRANMVNEIWHADITVFKTLDQTKHYIYTVIDNYSRKTLAWRLASVVSAKIRVETIKEAITNISDSTKVRLITDGGTENDNYTVKDFIKKATIDINHQIALRDIVQSNSMVEASYRTMKYSCLFLKNIQNRSQLLKELEFYFHEYDTLKPHYALGIYTPDEVYNGASPSQNLRALYKAEAEKRSLANKRNTCTVC